ncbi:MAG TPA: hypothetical protein VGE07_24120 [Herpetosiphonaceae bacterium]
MTERISRDPLDERPGVVEPQPDTTQPDVDSLPDMGVDRPNNFDDKREQDQDAAERQAISEKVKNE